MRNRMIFSLTFVSALFTIAACNDDDDKPASLLGNWSGDKIEATAKIEGIPAPISQNDNPWGKLVHVETNRTSPLPGDAVLWIQQR